MANLAIKGHPTRGKEVIKLLEMLGGEDEYKLRGDNEKCAYFEKKGVIYNTSPIVFNNSKLFTLEEFLEKFPYKVGDKVTHNMGILMGIVRMYWDAECNVVRYDIQSPIDNNYKLKAMLAEHLQPYKEETMKTITIDDFKANTKEWIICQLASMSKDDALQTISDIYDELQQSKYPKTFNDCCTIIEEYSGECIMSAIMEGSYKNDLISNFTMLLICRDAYWKIAGDWKPACDDEKTYCIYYNRPQDRMELQDGYFDANAILDFPTKKARDIFYENFKELIETCKELL